MAALAEPAHRRLIIGAEEDIGELRRSVARLASQSHAVRVGEVELVATELATNLLRHATSGGHVLYRQMGEGIELLAVDRGPGMLRSEIAGSDVGRTSSSDPGLSASRPGGLGAGLATVRRLASTFDLYSTKPEGSVVLTRLGVGLRRPAWCRWGAVNVPLRGESESGDGWAVSANGMLATVVVDGLGHGPAAAEASRAAISVFGPSSSASLEGFIASAHEAMRGTRGAVLSACVIDPDREALSFVGVGNVSARLLRDSASQSLVGKDGTMGTYLNAPKAHVQHEHWGPGATLVMASDGLASQWDPRPYPGLLHHDPTVVAAVLDRDFGRGTDDATVLVVQDLRRDTR